MELRPLKIGKTNIKPKNLLLSGIVIIGFGIGITAALHDKELIILMVCSLIGISFIIFPFTKFK